MAVAAVIPLAKLGEGLGEYGRSRGVQRMAWVYWKPTAPRGLRYIAPWSLARGWGDGVLWGGFGVPEGRRARHAMCGIVGFLDGARGHEDALTTIDAMCQMIRHRGPDEQGVWAGDGGVGLGMRRLAIIDLAGGQQPIANEDGSVLVVFNGEIYNHEPLRAELAAKGHTFRTRSDTETIVHAYEEYGDRCVEHLRGMFVFALWDRRRQRLLAARDRFGKKPFNYAWDGQRLVFGSEIKSLLAAGVPRALDPIALDEYLTYGYVPAPHTMFAAVKKLPAGHILVVENGQLRTERYWELRFEPTCQDDEETALARTRALLEDAVRVRLMSEVPLGAFLSGGVDSSLVVGLMSRMMDRPVKTFSIGFAEEDYSELPYARQMAQHFGTEHTDLIVRPELLSVLPELVWAYDEPFADESAVPTYYVSKLAREHVTVALSGDGGDEIFGGYERYARMRAVEQTAMPLRLALSSGSLLLREGMRGKNRFSGMRLPLPERYTRGEMAFSPKLRASLYSSDFAASLGGYDSSRRMLDAFAAAGDVPEITRMQYVDVQQYLSEDILVKVDKASMLTSLETRAPLLDQDLAQYVASLPESIRTPNGTLKSLLKRVASDLLPPEILNRKKQGFNVPLRTWFGNELAPFAREVLLSPQALGRGVFAPQALQSLVEMELRSPFRMNRRVLWGLLCLEMWFRVYMDTPVAMRPQAPLTAVRAR